MSIPFLLFLVEGSIPNSVIESKKAHLVVCLLGANHIQEVSHEEIKLSFEVSIVLNLQRLMKERAGVESVG